MAYAASWYDVHVVSDQLLGLSRERLMSIRSMNDRRKLWTTTSLLTINLHPLAIYGTSHEQEAGKHFFCSF